MSHTIRTLSAVAATAICAAGLQTSIPASAVPPFPSAPDNCSGHWIIFDTDSDIRQDNGVVVHVAWGRPGTGTATYSSPGLFDWQGPVTGGIVPGTANLDFTIPFHLAAGPFSDDPAPPPPTNHYIGTITSNGSASGTTVNDSGVANQWTIDGGFKCIGAGPAETPAPPPNPAPAPVDTPQAPPTDAISVRFDNIPTGGVSVNVTNSSSVQGDCTYDATSPFTFPFNKQFTVAANGTTSFDITGLQLGIEYQTVTQCTGVWQGATVVLGRVERAVTF